jgi:hypothetical protein
LRQLLSEIVLSEIWFDCIIQWFPPLVMARVFSYIQVLCCNWVLLWFVYNQPVGFLSILWCSQSGDDPQEVVSQIWIQDKYKGSFKLSFYIFGFVLDSCIEIWRFFLKFGGILANKKLKKHLILALLILIYLSGYI